MQTLQELSNTLLDREPFNAVLWKEKDVLHKIDSQQLFETILHSGKGLLELGLEPGDRVALFADNSPKWIGISLAINYAGLTDVPRGSDSTPEEIKYILDHSGAKIAIVHNKALYEKVMANKPKNLETIISIDYIEGVKNISYLQELGLRSEKQIEKVHGEQVASIIYTSGTTGKPKGVMLTHKNYSSNTEAVHEFLGDISKDRMISLLPPWHVFGRMEKYTAILGGAEVFYTSPKTLLNDLSEQSPTIMVSVPRIWESVYTKFMKNEKIRKITGIKNKWIREKLIGVIVPKVLKKKLGGRIRLVVSGGGALPEVMDRFFDENGLEVLEGYGMTETSPVISARKLGSHAIGTVGVPVKGVSVEIRNEKGRALGREEEGIIYVKGDNVMKGYYRDWWETRKVIGWDGFLNTGDLGYFDLNGNLVITGREKELIVLKSGENIHPTKLEDALVESPYILGSLVVGEHWPKDSRKSEAWTKLGALIIPDLENIESYCKENSIDFPSDNPTKVLDNPKIKSLFKSEIAKYVNTNIEFKAYESISAIRFVAPFEIGKELTGSYKPKRTEIVRTHHRESIEDMAAEINRN